MKKLLLSISLVLATSSVFGQGLGDDFYTLDFENAAMLIHLHIDPLTNQNNLWQVGSPQKTIFTSAYSPPNVIATDLTNPYPTNDTSVFTIINVASGYGWQLIHTATLQGKYYVNSDSLSDYGMIEFSPDNGTTWYDIVNDTAITNYISSSPGWVTLTGNSNGWQSFYVNLASLGPLLNIQLNDTVLYRFTFISDSIQTNKDGLMFDDLHFEDYFESIEEIQNDNLISISPNPASDELRIHKTKVGNKQSIQIFNYTGQVLYDESNFIGETINTRQLPDGIYLLKYSDTNKFCVKRFLVQH